MVALPVCSVSDQFFFGQCVNLYFLYDMFHFSSLCIMRDTCAFLIYRFLIMTGFCTVNYCSDLLCLFCDKLYLIMKLYKKLIISLYMMREIDKRKNGNCDVFCRTLKQKRLLIPRAQTSKINSRDDILIMTNCT